MATTYPPNFKSVVSDFINDLSTTFPEYSYLWSKWAKPDITDIELQYLYDYCMTVYPERFFDILNQNKDMFDVTCDINTVFLPNVDFKLLFHCRDITENTITALWKYLQLMLFTIVGGVKDKANFGDTMNMFENIDQEEFQNKLNETMKNMSDFFSNMTKETEKEEESNENNGASNTGTREVPNPEEMKDHLKGLFDGKIGKLAQEMAEDISEDFASMLNIDPSKINSTEDVMKELMKNPAKMMDLMKKVGGKLDEKMRNGDISKDEIMKEAGELMNKMKGMGNASAGAGAGGDAFSEMFKNMTKAMGNQKGARMDTNAIDRMTKQQAMKEKMLAKLRAKQEQKEKEKPVYSLESKSENEMVFRLEGEAAQEKSYIHPDILKEMAKEEEKEKDTKKKTKSGQKKKK
uniref:Uncharacterized protein n=1 Tax=viral metagenome TaxID=1070528 RepID=A0A6C0I444_9ZZZZ